MTNPVIKVENLSKSYLIGHQSQERYTALRDVLSNAAKGFVKNAADLVRGKQLMGNDTIEEFYALKDINFEIRQGDRVGIIGRNGAGKSTLLKILSRITEPTTGKITLNGRVASLLEVGTGFHPELTGRENIYLNGAILGMSRNDIKRKFDEIVAFAEVENFLDTPVKRYSSGMYVRLAFSVAAHLEPEIMIVDEVLAVGDAQFQKKCLGKMEDVSKEGRTVLFVSHNMGLITQLCNKGFLLNKGKIELDDNIERVVNRYIANSSTNLCIYTVERESVENKRNYFTKIFTVDSNKKTTSDFAFDDNITLHFDFVINEPNPNIIIGIGIQDKFQSRVTTVVQSIAAFNKKIDNSYSGSIQFQSSILAPNSYSFVFAIWVKDQTIYDNVEDICRVRIHDTGTHLAIFEGLDYGSIIIKAEWNNV